MISARSSNQVRRRPLLAGVVGALMLLAAAWAGESTGTDDAVAFFVVGDTHLLASKTEPETLEDKSASVTAKLIDAMNALPETEIPKSAGGGRVLKPRGVVHAGDCIDTGDQAAVKRQETEWSAFTREFGLNGSDGRLKFPTYEVHGNHDSPTAKGLAVQRIIARNKSRPDVTNVSTNGLHYSWDWGHVHFVNLGIVVGQTDEVKRKRRYDPLGSLDFLITDLKEKVGTSGRPVVITHHIDMLRYSQTLPIDDKKAQSMEWDPADVKAYFDALRGYNIAAILYGHTHARNIFKWNGTSKAASVGIPVFNVDNSSHYANKQQAFFYIEIRGNNVLVREVQTPDSWKTVAWTPQSWPASAIVVPKLGLSQ